MTRRSLGSLMLTLAVSVAALPARAQVPATAAPAAPDMIARILSGEFFPRFPAPPRWFGDGGSYLVSEPSSNGAIEVVRYDTATGARRDVLITAAQLTPAGATSPLAIESLAWSADQR